MEQFRKDEVDMSKWSFEGPSRADPVSFVRSFCADYKSWNDTAMTLSDGLTKSEKRDAMEEASDAYKAFLRPFITPDTKLQLVAFGSHSAFDPSRLEFSDVDDLSTGLSVPFSIKDPDLGSNDDYVAEIEKAADGKLMLKQVWYIDPFPEKGQERLAFL
ncbi:hypothetical protein [Halovulum sp. GXIMD14793]